MSALEFLNRPIGGGKKEKDKAAAPAAPAEPKAAKGPGPRRGREVHPETVTRPGDGALTVGGAPRVDLMPPEIRVKRSQLRTRRKLRLGLVAVVAITALGCGGAIAWNVVNQATLAVGQLQQQQLLGQQGQYGEVKSTLGGIALVQAGQRVGASAEVDWSGYLGSISAALPAGMSLTQVTIDSASPVSGFAQPTTPLQGGRIASVTIEARSADLPSVSAVMNGIAALPGYVDATPLASTYDSGTYTSTLTFHVGTAALTNRFTKAK
jgi:hypothetical protein